MRIGILGLINSGKDTFAAMLQEELELLGVTYGIDKYALPLKELTSKIYGLTLDELEDRVIKEKPVQVDRDHMVQCVFHTLSVVLKFTGDELDKASELYFEHFCSARAISPREFQQVFGTYVVRATKPSAWVEYLQSKADDVIVTDVRFRNELCKYNILMVRSIAETPKPVHASEHFAWELQFGSEPLVGIKVVPNYEGCTLDRLQYYARGIALHINETY